MNWYYVRDNKQDGPHSDEAIRELAKSGLINSSTSVWCEGMADWQPLSQAAAHLLPSQPPPPASTGGIGESVCGECGGVFPTVETVSLGGVRVCARCKPAYLQKLQEGVASSGRAGDLARLLKIAKAQRGVNLAILLVLVCYGLIFASGVFVPVRPGAGGPAALIPLVAVVGLLAVLIFQVINVYRLASALGMGAPIIWVLGVFFLSCIGLLLLLHLSSKATKELRKAGFKVGLLGADPNQIQQRLTGT
jgi:hypothetical protein